tara:strand:+ start:91 stop:273 length:183 start_codon:yes stop_codon:yes gene_type:complete
LFSLAWNLGGDKSGATRPRLGEGWNGCGVVGVPGRGRGAGGSQAKSQKIYGATAEKIPQV